MTGERAVAIGKFDGVHLGHRAVVQRMVDEAAHHGLTPTVLVLYPHPFRILAPEIEPKALTTFGERAELMRGLGAAEVIQLPFTAELSGLSPEAFCRSVLMNLQTARVYVGSGFVFGQGASGRFSDLKAWGKTLGFSAVEVPKVMVGGAPVSTSRIRTLLATGAAEEAAGLLGRPYTLSGVVVRGDGRGRTIGVPTANVATEEDKLLPKLGVYAVRARLEDGHRAPAVANIGTRPTVGDERPSIEVHLLDGAHDLYDTKLEVELIHYLRGQIKFSGLDALVGQIRADVAAAKRSLEIESPEPL